MSDEPKQPETGTDNPQPTQPASQPAQDDKDSVEYWKAQSRKQEARAKENFKKLQELEEKAARLDALENENKTEAEKLAAAQAKLAAYEQAEQVRSWISEVSADTKVPAELLRGNSLEEIQDHAQALQDYLSKTQVTVSRQGRTPTGGDMDVRQAARSLFSGN